MGSVLCGLGGLELALLGGPQHVDDHMVVEDVEDELVEVAEGVEHQFTERYRYLLGKVRVELGVLGVQDGRDGATAPVIEQGDDVGIHRSSRSPRCRSDRVSSA